MSSETTAVVPMNKGGVSLTSMDEAWRFCEAIARTDVVPKAMRGKPAEVFAVIQAGAELGVSPLRALANMKIINGRVGPMGSLAKAKVREANVLAKGTGFKEWFDGTEGEDDWTAHFQTRRGEETDPMTTSFSVKDAKRAGLWGKVGKFGPSPWVTYPGRMLMWRAVGFHMDDYYSDVLMGFHIAEVLADYPDEMASAVMEPVKEPMKDPLLDDLSATIEAMRPEPIHQTCAGMGEDPALQTSSAELSEDMADLVPDGVDPKTGEYVDVIEPLDPIDPDDPADSEITVDGEKQAPTSLSPLEEIMAEKAAAVPAMSEEEAMADLIREGVVKEEDLDPPNPDNKQEEGGAYDTK